MLKPRPLPPVHKNQLFMHVKSIGFFNDPRSIPPPVFRNHEVARKKLYKHKPYTGFSSPPASSASHHHDENTAEDHAENCADKGESAPSPTATPSQKSITSLIHIRGRASMTDVTAMAAAPSSKLCDVTTQRKAGDMMSPRDAESEEDDGDLGFTSFLTEDPTSSRSYEARSTSTIFSPALDCSKYNVIGESKFRKKRHKRSMWTLPKVASDTDNPKTNFIDLKSIYGAKSKIQQVPSTAKREDTIILPPLEVGNRKKEVAASLDADYLAEKRLVMSHVPHPGTIYYRKINKDHVPFPTAYKPYFRHRQRKQRFVRTLFSGDNNYAEPTPSHHHHSNTNSNTNSITNINQTTITAADNSPAHWESNSQPIHCSRCAHQSTSTLHFCDVLGRRFCRFCNEMIDRSFAHAYEGNSPFKSPTLKLQKECHNSRNDHNNVARNSQNSPLGPLQLQPELSFIGVRKVVIIKTVKDEGQGRDGDPDGDDFW